MALAKLYQSTSGPVDAHGVLAPALEGFSPTPEFPEIEEAQTFLAALAATDEVKKAAAARQRRLKLQTSYGRAMVWGKGFAAEETKAAFARAGELAADIENPAERIATYHGQASGSFMRGEFDLAREFGELVLRDAEQEMLLPEVAMGHRLMGMTLYNQGSLTQARTHFETALRITDPQWNRSTKLRFGMDSAAWVMVLVAHTHWMLGEIEQARDFINGALERSVEAEHSPTLANTYGFKAFFEVLRGDAEAARRAVESLLELSRAYELPFYRTIGRIYHGWVRVRFGERDMGLAQMREGLKAYAEAGNRAYVPWLQALLAVTESEQEMGDGPLMRVDEALALAQQTGEHWTDALLHRIRGEILLRRDGANTAPAEEAFLTAIAIAQQQKAKSFELRAALSLAKLYQSTNRAADAHAVLAPALEGFSPTPELPEIAEAQQLLGSLGL